MEYPFRMSGRVVAVHHFQVRYLEERLRLDGETIQEAVNTYFHTQEEAQAVANRKRGTVSELDASSYQWMDGLEVTDVPDTYAEAVKLYEMGEAAYQRQVAFDAAKRADQLRADLDYVMLMGGF